MDITIDPKKKKKESEDVSALPSKDKRMKNIGKNNPLPASKMNDLEEFDWDDPKNQSVIKKWDENSRKFVEKYELKGDTPVDKILKLTEELKKADASLSHCHAWDQAWETIMKKKVPIDK